MPTWIGRRVDSMDELTRPGDYFLNKGEPALWFLLPRVQEFQGEPENEHVIDHFNEFWRGTHRISAAWQITDEEDGTITVAPSIWTRTNYGPSRIETGWHGYLERGIWREV